MKLKSLLAGLLVALLLAIPATAQDAKPQYTVAEYNAYQACVNDANAASKLKCFEGFEATYPQSTLLPFVYAQGLTAAAGANNGAKAIEFADKVTSLGDKADVPTRFHACFLRANFFHGVFNARAANAADMATKARSSADACLALGGQMVKPEQATQQQFDDYMTRAKTLLNYTIGVTSAALKDYPRAVDGFKTALVTNPGDALIRYQMGVNMLQLTPPAHMDGFWSLARAINLKVAGEAQVRSYLKNQIVRYQGGLIQCEKETDAQVAELLALAAAGGERPADYSIPTEAEISEVQKQINILTLMKGLKEGGRTAKLTWLAACGLEFPEVQGKVISAADNGGGVEVNVFIGQTEEEFEAATTHNITAKVADQPEAARVKKDEPVKFAGRVAAFTPEPFVLTFDKAKVDPTTIPEAEAAPAKKAPAKKAPAKRPAKRPAQ